MKILGVINITKNKLSVFTVVITLVLSFITLAGCARKGTIDIGTLELNKSYSFMMKTRDNDGNSGSSKNDKNEDFSFSAHVERKGEGVWIVDFVMPSSLEGVTFICENGKITAMHGDMEVELPLENSVITEMMVAFENAVCGDKKNLAATRVGGDDNNNLIEIMPIEIESNTSNGKSIPLNPYKLILDEDSLNPVGIVLFYGGEDEIELEFSEIGVKPIVKVILPEGVNTTNEGDDIMPDVIPIN